MKCDETCECHEGISMSNLVHALRDKGYNARMTDSGVVVAVSFVHENSTRRFPLLISEGEGTLDFSCQIGTIGDLEEDDLPGLGWVLLALNAEIQPWGVALINPDGHLDPSDTIVLTDSIPLGDISPSELDFTMSSLERAIAAVLPTYVK